MPRKRRCSCCPSDGARSPGLKVLEFLGGKHANFNMGLWRRDVAARLGANDLTAVLTHLGDRADLVTLVNQPVTWAGATNPLALLPQQAPPISASAAA